MRVEILIGPTHADGSAVGAVVGAAVGEGAGLGDAGATVDGGLGDETPGSAVGVASADRAGVAAEDVDASLGEASGPKVGPTGGAVGAADWQAKVPISTATAHTDVFRINAAPDAGALIKAESAAGVNHQIG